MKARGTAAAALAAVLSIAGGATPARATGGPLVSSTGLTDGQLIGIVTDIDPVISADAVKVQVLVDGVVTRASGWPAKYLPVMPPSSAHGADTVVTVRAFDADGASGEATTTVRVDTKVPELRIDPRGDSVVHGVTTLTVTPAEDDLAEVRLLGYPSAVLARRTEAPWSFSWDFTGHTGDVWFSATDRAGNVSRTYNGSYSVDETGPRITPSFPPYAEPGKNWLGVHLDDMSAVDRLEWWIDGVLRSTETSLYYDFGSRIRKVPVEIRAWDRWGNASTKNVMVQLDASAPVISKVSPAQNALVRGTQVTSTIVASDTTGIRDADLDGIEATAGPGGVYTASERIGRDGRLTLHWHVWDNLSNLTGYQRTVIVDNTRPKITSVTAPKNGVKVPATVKTRMAATDLNGIHHVELRINGKKILSDSKAPYYLNLNATRYGRSFVVTFAAVDKAGNTISTSKRTWKR